MTRSSHQSTAGRGEQPFFRRADPRLAPAGGRGILIATLLAVIHGSAAAGEPAGTSGAGEIYVAGDAAGAQVLLDDVDTGLVVPVMVRGVGPGRHRVAVVMGCGRAEAAVDVEANVIARVELNVSDPGGTLDLTGAPPGALVRVDGTGVGELPWAGDLGCGSHTLEVAAPGFVPVIQTVDVPAGDILALKVELALEPRGALTIDVLPVDANLQLDGANSGVGPRTLRDVLPGLHTIDATRDGYRSAHATVDLAAGEVERVALVLEPRREVPLVRRVAGGTLLAGGLALGAWSTMEFLAANVAYGRFLAEPDDDRAHAIYTTEVQPQQVNGWVAAGFGVAALATGGGLFFIPSPEGAAVGVSGTF